MVVHKLLIDLDLAARQRQLDVQLTGPFLTIKHVGRHMVERAEQVGRRQDRQYFLGFGADGTGQGAPTVRLRAD